MTFDELKALDHAHTLQTYGRFDVDVDHGQGPPSGTWPAGHTSTSPRASGCARWATGTRSGPGPSTTRPLTLGHISNLFYSQPYARLAGPLRPVGHGGGLLRQLGRGRPTRGFSSWPANTATTSTAPAAAPS